MLEKKMSEAGKLKEGKRKEGTEFQQIALTFHFMGKAQ